MKQPTKGWSRWLWHVLGPVLPVLNVLALWRYPAFFSDLRKFKHMGGEAPAREWHPCLFDKTLETGVDRHYFYQAIWTLRKVVASGPRRHVDVGSDVKFVGMLTAVTDVTFVDIRPFRPGLSRFEGVEGSILDMPFEKDSLSSLSTLSVAEHIGLGRYGDPIDPDGTRKACDELGRVLAPGGDLYFGLPVGKPRVCFNAHRVHSPLDILAMFAGLELVEFSAVDDAGGFFEGVQPEDFVQQNFANGLFHFRKPNA